VSYCEARNAIAYFFMYDDDATYDGARGRYSTVRTGVVDGVIEDVRV